MPNMANLGLNSASHGLPLSAVPGGMHSGGFMSGGSYHSAHGMHLQAPSQVHLPQAYAAQVCIRNSVAWPCSYPGITLCPLYFAGSC